MGRNYWMFVGSPENFDIIKDLGFTAYALGTRYRRRAERMQPDDRVLFYVTQIRKWTATATITSRYFEDPSPFWAPTANRETFPYRVKLAPDIVLDTRDYIDALMLAPRLDYVKRWAPEDWPLAFFDRLHLLPQRDFRLIEGEMKRTLNMWRRSTEYQRPRKRGARPRQGQQRPVGSPQPDPEPSPSQPPIAPQ
jgi:predicted RNA-binding protein